LIFAVRSSSFAAYVKELERTAKIKQNEQVFG